MSAPEADDHSIEKWTTQEVVSFLTASGLGAISDRFSENEVTGLDLLLLTEDELKKMLGISKLQAAKVKLALASPEAKEAAAASDQAALDTAAQLSALRVDNSHAVPAVAVDAEDNAEVMGAELHSATSLTYRRAAPAAPAAAAAPGAPLLPAGTHNLQLDDQTVARYTTCCDTVARYESEGVPVKLPAARTKLDQLTKRFAVQKEQVDKLEEAEDKQEKKVAKLEAGKWYPGKYLSGAKRRDAKMTRNKDKLDEASNKLRAEGIMLDKLHHQVAQATQDLGELTAKSIELGEAREFCASLLEHAFAGNAVGDGRENTLEREVASLGPKLEECRRYKTVYSQAFELMVSARKCLDQATKVLRTASGLAGVDIAQNFFKPQGFRNTPGGAMVDIIKRQQMRAGAALARQGADAAIKARQLIPDMPRVQVEKLQQMRVGLGLFDVVFDNMISDMMAAAKIRNMLNTVESCKDDVRYAEQWLHGWITGRIDQDLRGYEAQLSSKRKELHAVRAELLRGWIMAKAQGATRAAPEGAAGGVAVGTPIVTATINYIL